MRKNQNSNMKPLFMWAGGKTRMAKYYKPFLPTDIDIYVEPFFGGGAMLLQVMATYRPSRVIINDIKADVMSIYRAIKDDCQSFLVRLDTLCSDYLKLSYDGRRTFYYDLRAQYAIDYSKWTRTEESATLYFLLKTCFNGIYQTNKQSNGRFGTPCGLLAHTDKVYDVSVVEYWHNILGHTEICSGDWESACPKDQSGTFFFFDPPYRDSFTSYGSEFDDTEQIRLLKYSKALQHSNVFLCNRDAGDGFFDRHKGNLNIERFDITYTAGRRKKTVEGFQAKSAVELLLHNRIGLNI